MSLAAAGAGERADAPAAKRDVIVGYGPREDKSFFSC